MVSLGLTVGALPYQNPPHVSHSVPAGCRDGPPAAPPPSPGCALIYTRVTPVYVPNPTVYCDYYVVQSNVFERNEDRTAGV